jgi:hypothetical protein
LGIFPPIIRSSMTAVAATGFTFVSWWQLWPDWAQLARPRTRHDCHHNTKVKPEAATAVIELLMIGGKTPKTCWAVNKRQDNIMKNCYVWLVIYLNCMMMHGPTILKFKNIITYSYVNYRVLRYNVQWNMYAVVVCCLVLLRVVPCNNLSSLSSNVLLFMILCVYYKFWESVILMDHVYDASLVRVHCTVSSLNAHRFP